MPAGESGQAKFKVQSRREREKAGRQKFKAQSRREREKADGQKFKVQSRRKRENGKVFIFGPRLKVLWGQKITIPQQAYRKLAGGQHSLSHCEKEEKRRDGARAGGKGRGKFSNLFVEKFG